MSRGDQEAAQWNPRTSLAPVVGSEELIASGVTGQVFSFEPRAVIITVAWVQAEDLLVKYVGDSVFTTISETTIKGFSVGAIYPFAIQEFKSTGPLEVGFTLMALK